MRIRRSTAQSCIQSALGATPHKLKRTLRDITSLIIQKRFKSIVVYRPGHFCPRHWLPQIYECRIILSTMIAAHLRERQAEIGFRCWLPSAGSMILLISFTPFNGSRFTRAELMNTICCGTRKFAGRRLITRCMGYCDAAVRKPPNKLRNERSFATVNACQCGAD